MTRRDEAGDAGLARGGEQVVGALGAQPVGLRERPVEVPAEARVRERGRLVDDRIGGGFEHRLAHGACVEKIERNRFCAERADALAAAGRGVGADHLVPGIDQLSNEAAADRTAGSCNEDSHRALLLARHIPRISGVYCYDTARRRDVTDE